MGIWENRGAAAKSSPSECLNKMASWVSCQVAFEGSTENGCIGLASPESITWLTYS